MNKFQTAFFLLLTLTSSLLPAAALDITNEADPYVVTIPSGGGTDSNAYTATALHNLKVTGSFANYTLSGALSGSVRLVVDYGSGASTNNSARLMLNNTSNSFTGGIQLTSGTLRVENLAVLANNQIDFNGGVLMTSTNSGTYAGNMTLASGSWGGLRTGINTTFSGVISGDGDLVVVTENGFSTILSGANTYTGVTSVGTVQGGANTYGVLVLGADNTLPAATVLEIGSSRNKSVYKYENTSRAEVQLNGKTNTVAGLYGNATANLIGGGTLNINVPEGQSYEYKGKFTTTPSIGIGGSGTQTFSNTGAITLATLTLTSGKLEFSAATSEIKVSTLTIDKGKMELNGRALTIPVTTFSGSANQGAVANSSETTSTVTLTYNTDGSRNMGFLTGNIRLVASGTSGMRLKFENSTSTITGGITIKTGVVRPMDGNMTSAIFLAESAEFDPDAIILDGGTIQNSSGNITILANHGITVTKNGGSIRMGNNQSTSAEMNSVISGEGWFGVSRDMKHPVKLNAQNTYQGETRIGTSMNGSSGADAVLATMVNSALPQTTNVVFGTASANLQLNGKTQSIGSLISRENCDTAKTEGATADMGLISTTETANLTIGNQNAGGNFTGRIYNGSTDTTKTINLTKVGTGTQVLGGSLENTRTDLTVQAGTVELNKTGTAYAARNVKISGGTVKLTGSGTNQIGGSLTLEKSTTGNPQAVLDLNGKTESVSALNLPTASAQTGETLPKIDLNGGSLSGALNANCYGIVTNSSAGKGTLTLNAGSTWYSYLTMSGNVQFVKQGGGRLYWYGGKNYSGGTTIEGGILYVDGNNTGTGPLEFKNGATLMNGGTTTYANDVVLTGNGNFRGGGGANGTVITLNGKISGTGKLTFNSGEANGGSFILSGENTYSGGTEMLGTGANGAGYTITLQNSDALGTGSLTLAGGSTSAYGLVLDTASGSLDVANQIIVNSGKTLNVSKTGTNTATISGKISGAGTLNLTGVEINLNLDELLTGTSDTLWDFTGKGNLTDIPLNLIAETPADYNGKTIKLVSDATQLTGLDLKNLNFEQAGGDIWKVNPDGSLILDSNAVPEPSTFVLLFLGLLGLLRKNGRR